jgi:thiol-disulfide isomerase/thioredoxin
MYKYYCLVIVGVLLNFQKTFAQFESIDQSKEVFKPSPAPDFELVDLEGKQHQLSAWKGKVIYLEFWATWCGACRKQMKVVDKLKHKFEGNDKVVFIQVSTDKDREKWVNFLNVYKPTGLQLYSDNGKLSNVRSKYDVKYLPKSFLIDSEGNIALDPAIFHTYDIEEEINALVKEIK